MKKLGGRVRTRREVLGISLSETARLSGISPSALSQIENSKAYPSIVTLKSIAETLNTTVGDLIGENETIKFDPLMLKSDRILLAKDGKGGELYQISYNEPGKFMGTYFMTLDEGAVADKWFREHSGQGFCYLISGEIQFEMDKKVYNMSAGDTLYFNSLRPHKAINTHSVTAELLYVITPVTD